MSHDQITALGLGRGLTYSYCELAVAEMLFLPQSDFCILSIPVLEANDST